MTLQTFKKWIENGAALRAAEESPEFDVVYDDLLAHMRFKTYTEPLIIREVLRAITAEDDRWRFMPGEIPNMINNIEKLMTDNEPKTARDCYEAFLKRKRIENDIDMENELEDIIEAELNQYEADYWRLINDDQLYDPVACKRKQ